MYDAETIAALQSGQLVLRDFLTVRGQTLAGAPVTFCFWTGEDNVSVNVVAATDGDIENRVFIGGGSLLGVPAIVDAIGLEARSVEFGLNQILAATQDMVRGNNIRVAPVEMHRGLFDPDTWALVSTPFPRFLGRVDGAEITTGAEGEEGGIAIAAVTSAIELTKTNPAMSSDEQQKLRAGDRFRKYSDAAGQVEIWWGQSREKGPD